jgi:glutathione synthase/RimK-type ligase-like ATP-grasp enzyme
VILLYGRGDDAPMQGAAEAAREHDVPLIWLDQLDLSNADLMICVDEHGGSGLLRVAGAEVALDTVSGVYARPLELPRVWPDELSRVRAETFHELLLEWLEISPRLVVNRPVDMESNSSKPFQSQLIAEAGFDVPETLVTSDPDEARAFWKEHERVVFKSISGVRSIVTEMSAEHAARLDRLRSLPAQFQAHVSGDDVRVHVVGEKTFACVIESQATDYRYSARQGVEARLSAFDLPECISSRCIDLAHALRLPFCGIDLCRATDGRWVCFEVNPMPAYTYFENGTGLPISQALIELLSTG